MIDTYVASLVQYGLDKGLIEESDRTYIRLHSTTPNPLKYKENR